LLRGEPDWSKLCADGLMFEPFGVRTCTNSRLSDPAVKGSCETCGPLMVQTASVSFPDESFWVTVGAAAPVIALAAIVSVSDMSGAWERFTGSAPPGMRGWMFEAAMDALARMKPTERASQLAAQRQALTDENQRRALDLAAQLWPKVRRGQRAPLWGALIASVNIALQLAMLAIALASLANHSNAVGPILAEITVPLGVLLLLASTVLTIWLRSLARSITVQIRSALGRPTTDTQGDAGGPSKRAP
jgi:hypothetical protein